MEKQSNIAVMVIWREKQINVEINANSTVKDFGEKLLSLTKVKAETMRLLVPQSTSKGSKLLSPFSDEYSSLNLEEISILKGKPIRMMGVFDYEIKEVSQNGMKPDPRISGFDEADERLRQRLLNTPEFPLKHPQGPYIFGGFHTLHLPGIELNPPTSEALRRMHMLACDPGIVAIMNKHHLHVGIMTEMAPVGYVGISPKCVLGFNKNHGEEISLRLRTDDLKGFRKYESIKKTLLHELAHMVYSEHHVNFYALDKQLNQEAASFDWTKSGSQTLSGHKVSDHYEDVFHAESSKKSSQKLRGQKMTVSSNARASSVAAAYSWFLNATSTGSKGPRLQMENINAVQTIEYVHQSPNHGQTPYKTVEPDPDDGEMEALHDNAPVIAIDHMKVDDIKGNYKIQPISPVRGGSSEFDSDDSLINGNMLEPDPDDSLVGGNINFHGGQKPDGSWFREDKPDPDDSGSYKTDLRHEEPSRHMNNVSSGTEIKHLNEMTHVEPDPDDTETKNTLLEPADKVKYNPDDLEGEILRVEPDPDDATGNLNSEQLQRLEEPVGMMCKRLQKAIEMLQSEATPVQAASSLQTLVKFVSNVIDHPEEVKFRKLRKANPLFLRNVTNIKAAMEVLSVIGFCEDVMTNALGRMETYLFLRNHPGLL